MAACKDENTPLLRQQRTRRLTYYLACAPHTPQFAHSRTRLQCNILYDTHTQTHTSTNRLSRPAAAVIAAAAAAAEFMMRYSLWRWVPALPQCPRACVCVCVSDDDDDDIHVHTPLALSGAPPSHARARTNSASRDARSLFFCFVSRGLRALCRNRARLPSSSTAPTRQRVKKHFTIAQRRPRLAHLRARRHSTLFSTASTTTTTSTIEIHAATDCGLRCKLRVCLLARAHLTTATKTTTMRRRRPSATRNSASERVDDELP